MKTLLCRPVRAGLLLSTIVALLAFAARLVEAQPVAASHPSLGVASPTRASSPTAPAR